MRGKSLVQARNTGGGVRQVLSSVAKDEGMRSLYQGLTAQLSKSLMSAAVKYAIKERVENLLLQSRGGPGTKESHPGAPKT